MVALAAPRSTPSRDGKTVSHPVKAATTIYQGGLTCLDANGWAVPGGIATTLIPIGRAKTTVANAGANGDLRVEVERDVYRWNNSAAGDLIARTEIGKDCYIVDDQTVAKTSNGSTRSIAGKVVDVDAQGVWVRTGI